MECHAVTSASCQLVHARCAKILDIRARAGLLEDLVATDFLLLVHRVEDFVRCSAAVTGVQCPNLRIALQSQAKNFLENFHDSSRKKMRYVLTCPQLEIRVRTTSPNKVPGPNQMTYRKVDVRGGNNNWLLANFGLSKNHKRDWKRP